MDNDMQKGEMPALTVKGELWTKGKVHKSTEEETALRIWEVRDSDIGTFEADNSSGHVRLRASYLQELLEAYEGTHLSRACDGFNPTGRQGRHVSHTYDSHLLERSQVLLIWAGADQGLTATSSRLRVLLLF